MPFYEIIEDSSYLFAICDNGLFRTSVSEWNFVSISQFNATTTNKFIIINPNGTKQIVILSDSQFWSSDENQDIFTDDILSFYNNITNTKSYDGTSLNVINNVK